MKTEGPQDLSPAALCQFLIWNPVLQTQRPVLFLGVLKGRYNHENFMRGHLRGHEVPVLVRRQRPWEGSDYTMFHRWRERTTWGLWQSGCCRFSLFWHQGHSKENRKQSLIFLALKTIAYYTPTASLSPGHVFPLGPCLPRWGKVRMGMESWGQEACGFSFQ